MVLLQIIAYISTNMTEETVFLGKPAAVWSYLTFVGLLIAFSMNGESKNPFAAFHIRQSLGLNLLFILLMIPMGYFDTWMISAPFYLGFFALWLFAIISAFQGKLQPVPLVGGFFQNLFGKK